MKIRQRLVFLLLILFQYPLFAQVQDTTLAWADRLLLDEVPYAVINRIDRNSKPGSRNLSILNRLTDACLIGQDFSRVAGLFTLGDSLVAHTQPFDEAYLDLNWSRYQYERSDYPSSIEHGLLGMKILEHMKIRPKVVNWVQYRIALQLGKSYLQMKQWDESRSFLDAALKFFDDDSLRYAIPLAQTHYALGLWFKNTGRRDMAIQHYQKSIRILEASDHERYQDLGKCYNNLATVYHDGGDYGHARENYLRALQNKKRHITDSLSLAITYNNLGRFYAVYGNNYQARENFESSIALLNSKDKRHRERLPELLNNYGGLLMTLDEQDGAEKYFRQSLHILQEDGASANKLLAPLISLSGVLINRDDFREAGLLLDKAEHILADSQSTRQLEATWHFQKGNLQMLTNDATGADRQFQKALQVLDHDQPLLASDIYLQSGGLRFKRKDMPGALTAFSKARNIVEQYFGEKHPLLSSPFNLMGATFLNMGETDSAIYCFQKAIDNNLAARKGNMSAGWEAVFPIELISSYYYLSKVYQQRFTISGQVAELEISATFVNLGLRAIDTRRKSLAMTNDQLVFDAHVSVFFERAMETYLALQQKHPVADHLERMFYISELAKSQSLGQSLRQSNLRAFSNVSATLQQEEHALRDKIQTLDLQSLKAFKSGADTNPALVSEYEQDLNLATGRYQRLQDSIRQNLPGYYQLKYDKTLVTAADIQRDILAVEPGTAVIQFIVGDSSVYAHVVTEYRQEVYRVENAGALQGKVLAFRNQIRLSMTNELQQTANELYVSLLSKAEPILRNGKRSVEHLIIIPDQILCYLPFEALIRRAGSGKYLIHEMDISYAYSATLLWQKYKEKSVARPRTFVGYAPEFGQADSHHVSVTRDEAGESRENFHFQPLSGNLTEVNTISNGMIRQKFASQVIRGRDATESSFRKLDLRQYDYVHLATHSFVDMDNPRRSGVAFSREATSGAFDDILFTSEVYEMQFNARLVCLSSCESGIGKIYRGEGMMGLAQAFLFAGAKNLAVSLWKVDDEATSDLMIDFYSRIPNHTLSSALSGAKRKMASSKKFSHPYYWSSFILIGM